MSADDLRRDDPPTVLLLTDPAMAVHAWPGHPERPERLDAVAAGVREGAGEAGATLVEHSAEPISADLAATVHDRAYVEWLEARDADGGGWIDPDTYVVAGSWTSARLAAGLAVAAARSVVRRDATVAFAVVRPPGHHAGQAHGKGFCLLNNVAIAVAALRADPGLERLAVLDWDVHHGDGSAELFAADPAVFYASTHQSPWYPGTGAMPEAADSMVTVPLRAETGDEGFVDAWQQTVLPRLAAFRPEAIIMSAGFDAHRDDPLAWLEVSEQGFGEVARSVGETARELGLTGVALALEGGYDLAAIRASAGATVRGLVSGIRGSAEPGPRT
jgi:acetoin utilization deacetylase AcuC-like enzyme